MSEILLHAKPIIAGRASGLALVSRESLSFWGGYSVETGEIIDRRHDLSGRTAAGRVLVFPHGRGSSTASAVLMESLQRGTAPAAIINLQTSPILALGSIVADEMYGKSVPILVLPEAAFYSIREDDRLTIEENGTVRIERGN